MATRSIYRGPRRKLVLAFDVGTTYSGISYRQESFFQELPASIDNPYIISILDPGQVPETKGVTRSVLTQRSSAVLLRIRYTYSSMV